MPFEAFASVGCAVKWLWTGVSVEKARGWVAASSRVATCGMRMMRCDGALQADVHAVRSICVEYKNEQNVVGRLDRAPVRGLATAFIQACSSFSERPVSFRAPSDCDRTALVGLRLGQ